MAANDASPIPIRAVPYRLGFPMLDASGTPTSGCTAFDSEKSLDGGAFSDCASEATAIGKGFYYLDLSSTETDASLVCVHIACGTTGVEPTPIVLYPDKSMVVGTIAPSSDYTHTASIFESNDITENTADHFVGRHLIFESGNLWRQATRITDYSSTGTNGRFTVETMTEAPSSGDKFLVV